MNQLCITDKTISVYYLLYICYCFLFGKGTLFIDLTCQVAALAKLSDDEDHAISIVLRQYLHDVWFASEFPKEV
jgi:hypothetical protein